MASRDELRAAVWKALLEALDKCQEAIDQLEKLDAGRDELIAEWQELDQAFAHLHNVKRWVGREWGMGQEPKQSAPTPPTETMVLSAEEARNLLKQMQQVNQNKTKG
jgi:hypothetical protein